MFPDIEKENNLLQRNHTVGFFCSMGMLNGYKRKKEPLENRQLILEAATDLINRKGIDSMSLDAVAKMAKLSKGGLMHHFPKKEALIDQLFQDRLLYFTSAFEQQLVVSRSPAIAFLKTVVEENLDERQKRALNVMAQACFNNDQYRQLFRQWFKEHILADANQTSMASLAAILVADSLLLSNVFNIYSVSKEQKQHLVSFLEQLEKDL